jgi:hypothetical protein
VVYAASALVAAV